MLRPRQTSVTKQHRRAASVTLISHVSGAEKSQVRALAGLVLSGYPIPASWLATILLYLL